MARKRMISPEIWESQDFSQLSDLAKIVFISLFSHADDAGRGRADPTYIKSSTFPYDEGRRVADIKSALSEIARSMSVQFYSVNGIEFYFMTSWERWQKIDKPSKSKLPPPPSVGVGGDIPNCEKFDEDSTNIRRTFDEASSTNRREENGIERNRSCCNRYGLHGKVNLTQSEYDSLSVELGESALKDYIERLDGWLINKAVSRPHANVILKWYREDRHRQSSTPTSSDTDMSQLNEHFNSLTEEEI